MTREKQPACGQRIAMAKVYVAPEQKVADGVRYVNVKQGKNAFDGIGKGQER